MHSIKYMTYVLEQLLSWINCWVCWLLKANVVMTWLQYRVLLFLKHGEPFPGFGVLLFIPSTMLFLTFLLPVSSSRFLVRLKAVTGSFWKTFFRNLFFQMILLMFAKNRLNVIAKEMHVFIGLSILLPFISSFLSSFSTVLMCLPSSSVLYPCLKNHRLSSLQWCSKFFDVVQIHLIHSAWLYGKLSFNNFGCSEFMWRKLCQLVCFLYILV